MKKALFVLLALGLFSSSLLADNISLRADFWAPYNAEPNSDTPGYIIEIAALIFKEKGHTVDYAVMPWTRALNDARNGDINGVVGAIKEDAPDFVFPQNEQGMFLSANFFIKKGKKWKFEDFSSLKKEKIGTIKGYSYGEKLDEYFKNNSANVDSISGEHALELNINKLIADRISVVVENKLVMEYKLKEMKLQDRIEEAGAYGEMEKMYIAFSPKNKKSKEYAEILSNGMDKIRKNGELKKILDKYGIKDWK